MTLDELKIQVRSLLASSFAAFGVQFEMIGDDPNHVGVSVFSVPRDLVHHVEDKILDLDAKFCGGTEFILTPLVRDEATTRNMYPEHTSPWQVAMTVQMFLCIPRVSHSSIERLVADDSREWAAHEHYSLAANEELALAA